MGMVRCAITVNPSKSDQIQAEVRSHEKHERYETQKMKGSGKREFFVGRRNAHAVRYMTGLARAGRPRSGGESD